MVIVVIAIFNIGGGYSTDGATYIVGLSILRRGSRPIRWGCSDRPF